MARIVVADDDLDIRDLIEFKLTTLGHEIVAVSDGAAVLDACREQRPDLCVLDVTMPGMSGLDTVRLIRADLDLLDLPVLLLSARSLDKDVATGLGSGADDYLTKPFSPRELGTRVEALLAR
ncbi:response regulator transcription factor [Nocardioides sp. GXZ039]|uniref:response regulator transcription factor n=1 Tax=Nocardioides sp. GXZ039 TaxID=3136018 RepID=UPI0030F442E5